MSTVYAQLAETFDAVAPAYDQMYSASTNAMMRWMRRESHRVMLQTFPRSGHLLDIGCGTGDDALALAAHDFSIFATDISTEMTAIVADKVATAGLADRITVRATPAGHLTKSLGQITFDGAYSNFGALNCEPDLQAVVSTLYDHLSSGGAFICTVMAPLCPFESLWFATHLQLKQAARRWKPGWSCARVSDAAGVPRTVPTRYLSHRALQQVFGAHFSIERMMSLPLLLPPPYLTAIYQRYQRLWAGLVPVEHALRDRWPFNRAGDHLLFVMRRR